eukprot:4998639-Prymnesium_polylepis.1
MQPPSPPLQPSPYSVTCPKCPSCCPQHHSAQAVAHSQQRRHDLSLSPSLCSAAALSDAHVMLT